MRNQTFKRTCLTVFFLAAILFLCPVRADAAGGKVTVSIEKFTIGQGYIVEPTTVEYSDGDTAALIISQLLTDKGYTFEYKGTYTDTFYLYQINGADNGRYVVPYCIKNMGSFVTSGGDTLSPPTGEEINVAFPDLSEYSYMSTAGWMYTVADQDGNAKDVSSKALSDFYPEDGDIIRFQFTLYGYGADLGIIYDNEDFPLKLPDRNLMTGRLALMNENKAKLMTNDNFRKAYDQAMNAIISLNTSQTLMEEAMEALPSKDEIIQFLEEYDANAVELVKTNINAIEDVIDTSQETLILSTQEAYEELSDAQKDEVGEELKSKLYAAVASLQSIKDQAAADELAELVENLGEVTLDKETDILIIDNMYQSLSDGARACLSEELITSIEQIKEELEDLKTQYEADKKAANTVANKIYAIGTVALTKATRIRNIRQEYDALSDGAKSLIPESIYQILIDAETELDTLEAANAAASKLAADKASAAAVTAKINALGTVTLAKASAVTAARAAYNALNTEAKAMVSSAVLSKLIAAEEKIAVLKKAAALKKKYTPAKVNLKSAKVGKKKVKLTWKKIKTATGYQIYMSTKKSSGYKKIATIKKAKTVTYTRKKLKSKKTYYFRVRAYRKVGSTIYYGTYSAVKKAKVK